MRNLTITLKLACLLISYMEGLNGYIDRTEFPDSISLSIPIIHHSCQIL